MMATNDRIIHIEGRVDRLETDVNEIKTGVQKLLDRPITPGFGQVITTLLSTLAACAILAGFGEWRINQALIPVADKAVRLEMRTSEHDRDVTQLLVRQAVLEERSKWLRSESNWVTKTEKLQ